MKDICNTANMPTQQTPRSIPAIGRMPRRSVHWGAGALILGNTDTMEFASTGRLAATRNPHNLARTRGGSSSGSAVAVADIHAPLALGTQTSVSLIRPSSFCGVYAMKPTWNAVSTEEGKLISTTLDNRGLVWPLGRRLGFTRRCFRLAGQRAQQFQTTAGARILVDATAYKADAASLDLQAGRPVAVAVRRDLAEILTPLDGMWEIVSRSERRTAFLQVVPLQFFGFIYL